MKHPHRVQLEREVRAAWMSRRLGGRKASQAEDSLDEHGQMGVAHRVFVRWAEQFQTSLHDLLLAFGAHVNHADLIPTVTLGLEVVDLSSNPENFESPDQFGYLQAEMDRLTEVGRREQQRLTVAQTSSEKSSIEEFARAVLRATVLLADRAQGTLQSKLDTIAHGLERTHHEIVSAHDTSDLQELRAEVEVFYKQFRKLSAEVPNAQTFVVKVPMSPKASRDRSDGDLAAVLASAVWKGTLAVPGSLTFGENQSLTMAVGRTTWTTLMVELRRLGGTDVDIQASTDTEEHRSHLVTRLARRASIGLAAGGVAVSTHDARNLFERALATNEPLTRETLAQRVVLEMRLQVIEQLVQDRIAENDAHRNANQGIG